MKSKILMFAFMLFAGALTAQPTIWGGAKLKLQQGDTSFISTLGAVKSWLGLSGGGTVSSFSSGNLSPLFTTSVATATTTPALSFALSNAAANTYLGNATGSTAAPSYTAAGALTKTDDTNVTLTLGGNASTSLLRDASLTLGWTGTLAVSRGGTGAGTLTGLLQGNGTSAVTAITNSSTAGQVLRVTGVSTYAWGALDLADADAVTGILPGGNGGTGNGFFAVTGPTTSLKTFTFPNASATVLTTNAAVTVAQGGTGATSLSGVLFGNGTSAFTATALGGDVTLYGSNGAAPLFYSLGITTTAAAIGFSRSSSTLNLNLPDADASNRGTVSTGTQTFAGAKTFSGAVTVSGLATASAGMNATAGASQAAVNAVGVIDGTITAITANTTLDHTHNFVEIGTLAGNITITLPSCSSTTDGWEYSFEKTGSDAFAFIIDPNSTQTFYDGATTKTIYSQGSKAWCKCNQSASSTWLFSTGK